MSVLENGTKRPRESAIGHSRERRVTVAPNTALPNMACQWILESKEGRGLMRFRNLPQMRFVVSILNRNIIFAAQNLQRGSTLNRTFTTVPGIFSQLLIQRRSCCPGMSAEPQSKCLSYYSLCLKTLE